MAAVPPIVPVSRVAQLPCTYGFQSNKRDNEVYIELLGGQSFYTAGDLLKGQLRVDPTTKPTRITISLKAISIIRGGKSAGPDAILLNATQELFVSKTPGLGEYELLRRGASKDGRVELPFFFTLPSHVSLPPPADRNWVNPDDSYDHPRFQHSPGFALPPSYGIGIDIQSQKVIYQLEARRESSTSVVKIRHEIKFIPPAPEYHPALLQPDRNFNVQLPPMHCAHKFIRTRKLLPDYDSLGKREKLKDLMIDKDLFGLQSTSEVPYVKFTVFATPARIMVLGSQVLATISVQHVQRSPEVLTPPDIFLRRLKVRINSIFNTYVPPNPKIRRDSKEPVHTEKDEFIIFDKKYEKGSGEPLYDGLNLLDIGDVRLDNDKIVPSFTSYGINLEHEIIIEIWGECLDREWQGIACIQPVQIVSDWFAPGVALQDPGLGDVEAHLEVDHMAQMRAMSENGDGRELGEEVPAYQFQSPELIAPSTPAVPPPPYVG